MSAPSIVVLSLVAMLSIGVQPKPSQGKVVSVEIIVDTFDGHQKRCKGGGGVQPTTVLIVGKGEAVDKEVYHCVPSGLIKHDDKHPEFAKTVVEVSTGDSIRWYSKTAKFNVVDVRLHPPITKGAPPYPFVKPMTADFADEVTSPPVRNVEGDVRQQYKISFDIGKKGNRVDPDVVCSM